MRKRHARYRELQERQQRRNPAKRRVDPGAFPQHIDSPIIHIMSTNRDRRLPAAREWTVEPYGQVRHDPRHVTARSPAGSIRGRTADHPADRRGTQAHDGRVRASSGTTDTIGPGNVRCPVPRIFPQSIPWTTHTHTHRQPRTSRTLLHVAVIVRVW